MSHPLRSSFGVLLLVLAAPVLSASQSRGPSGVLTGRVLDSERAPVAGARVVLMHRSIPACLAASAHRREVVTGEDGMFRVELPDGRAFSAWAAWPSGATAVVEGVTANGFVELVEDPTARSARVEITGAEAWATALGPLSFRVSAGSENLDLVRVALAAGVLSIPRLPRLERRHVEVLDHRGEVVWAAAPETLAGGRQRLELPALAEVTARVLDAATSRPIAGAEIRRLLPPYRFAQRSVVAAPMLHGEPVLDEAYWVRTDRLGRAMVLRTSPDRYVLAVTARGWAGRRLAAGDVAATSAGPARLDLSARPVVEGRVLDGSGAPVAGVLIESARFVGDRGGLDTGLVPTPVARELFPRLGPGVSDERGRFRMAVLPADGLVGLRARVPGRPGLTSPPSWVSCFPGGRPRPVTLRVAVDR